MRKIIIALICLALLALAIAGAVVFVKTAPKAKKERPPKTAPLVETQPLVRTNETVVLHLTGTVIPAEAIQLRARVGGEIVSLAPGFIDGGLLKKGDEVLKIDPTDYELALAAAKSKLATAEFNHKMELGRGDVAQCEWEQLKTDSATKQEKELALRKPHLAASEAALQAAEAAVEKARLDLARTQIRAPFNTVVISREVNVGSQTTPSGMLARLAGTDVYWIKVSIPVDRLPWLEIPGSPAKVLSTSGVIREGRVIRLLGDIEAKGRMARILVEVDDPLCLKPENKGGKPLLLGEYVRTQIRGRELEGIHNIPRNALREGDLIWIARSGKLEIREAEVLWRGKRNILIRALDGEQGRLIVSDLTAPIQGMGISTGENKKEKPRNTPNTRKKKMPNTVK